MLATEWANCEHPGLPKPSYSFLSDIRKKYKDKVHQGWTWRQKRSKISEISRMRFPAQPPKFAEQTQQLRAWVLGYKGAWRLICVFRGDPFVLHKLVNFSQETVRPVCGLLYSPSLFCLKTRQVKLINVIKTICTFPLWCICCFRTFERQREDSHISRSPKQTVSFCTQQKWHYFFTFFLEKQRWSSQILWWMMFYINVLREKIIPLTGNHITHYTLYKSTNLDEIHVTDHENPLFMLPSSLKSSFLIPSPFSSASLPVTAWWVNWLTYERDHEHNYPFYDCGTSMS